MNDTNMRSKFEAWATAETYIVRRDHDGYWYTNVEDMWKTWQACAASVQGEQEPELLEALQMMVEMYEAIQPSGGYQGVYDISCAAIAKATGEPT